MSLNAVQSTMNSEKWKIILCFCRGVFHAQKDFNLWEYVNQVNQFDDIEFVTIIPMACTTYIPNASKKEQRDGENFFKHFIHPGEKYILAACDRDTQRKKLREDLENIGINFEETFYSLDLRFIDAETGIQRTRKLLDELKNQNNQ